MSDMNTAPSCCEKAAPGTVCDECAKISAAYSAAMGPETVCDLPDHERRALIGNYFADDLAKESADGLLHDYARALAAQPPAQPADAQPFAYLARAESGNTIIWSVDPATVKTAAEKYGRPLEALYLAPATIKESLTVEVRTQEGAAS